MSWQESINPTTAVWRGVEAYAAERIQELTDVCVSVESSESAIRQAQAGIAEMRVLLALPNRLMLTNQQGRKSSQNRGY